MQIRKKKVQKAKVTNIKLPHDFLSELVGYEKEKKIVIASILSTKRNHILLSGVPASGKTVILESIKTLPNAEFIVGGSSTKSGMGKLIKAYKPAFLCIDEIDKCDAMNTTILLTLMESGFIRILNSKEKNKVYSDTKVYAACNNIDRLSLELQSRFTILSFPEYTEQEAYNVMYAILVKKGKVRQELASNIAYKIVYELKSKNPRTAFNVLAFMEGGMGLDEIISVLLSQKEKKIPGKNDSIEITTDEARILLKALDIAKDSIRKKLYLYNFPTLEEIVIRLKRQVLKL